MQALVHGEGAPSATTHAGVGAGVGTDVGGVGAGVGCAAPLQVQKGAREGPSHSASVATALQMSTNAAEPALASHLLAVGEVVGAAVGDIVGAELGIMVGAAVGDTVGAELGTAVGKPADDEPVGDETGAAVLRLCCHRHHSAPSH